MAAPCPARMGAYCSLFGRGVPFGAHARDGCGWCRTLAAWETGKGAPPAMPRRRSWHYRACRRREPMPSLRKACDCGRRNAREVSDYSRCGCRSRHRARHRAGHFKDTARGGGRARPLAARAEPHPAGAPVRVRLVRGRHRGAGQGARGPGRRPDEQRRGEPVPAQLRVQRPGQPELPERHRPRPAGPRPGAERDRHRAEPVQPAPGGGRVQRLPAR